MGASDSEKGEPAPACKYCKTPLLPNAIYCKECEKYQTWPSLLLNTLLDAKTLVALVPIVTLSVAYLYDHLVFPYSSISLAVVRCDLNGIHVAASNKGPRPGMIAGGRLSQSINGSKREERVLVADQVTGVGAVSPGGSGTIINPGVSVVIGMTMRDGDATRTAKALSPETSKTCKYDIKVDVIDFGKQSPKANDLACTCPGV